MSHDSRSSRLDHLDAVRAFALLLGIVFHASLSFLPFFIGWAVMDVSTSGLVAGFILISHSFRMEVFFLIAGFFSHLTFHRKGAGEFVRSRFLRIVVPFVLGWFLLRPLIVSGWIMGGASLRGDVDIAAGLLGGFKSLETLPAGIFVGSHLWFLYYLVLITGIVLLLRGLLQRTGRGYEALARCADAVLGWMSRSPFSVSLFALPTAGAMWFMRGWGMDTPEHSLQPHVPVLLIYGGFFTFGWILHRQADLLGRFARLSILRGVLAVLGIVGTVLVAAIEGDPGHPRYLSAHVVFALSYAVMMWSLVFLTIGVFEKLIQRTNRIARYVADSSYWMYLIHLPIVVWLQVAVAELPLHWLVKLTAISVVTIAVSLLTYDLFVRATFIGQLLNGRRRERAMFVFPFGKGESETVLAPRRP